MKTDHFKCWLRAAVFLVLLGILLAYVEQVLFSKNNISDGFYAEPENTLDVVYFGSSLSNTGIYPTAHYENYGFTGYVMYNWSQTPWAAYYYAKEALKTQSPRVLVVETNMFLYGRQSAEITDGANTVSNANALKIPAGWNRTQLAWAMNRWQTDHPSWGSLMGLYQNHANWKGFVPADLLPGRRQLEPTVAKGYGPLYVTEAFSTPHYPQPEAAPLYEGSALYLEKFFALSQKENIPLVFITFPSARFTEDDYAHLAAIHQACAAQDVPVLDLSAPDLQQQIGFDYASDMADVTHLNFRGAKKLNGLLGDFLHTNYSLPDHRQDPQYADWATAAQINRRDDEDYQIKITAALPALLELTRDSRFLTVVYAVGDMTAADPGDLPAALAAYGIAPERFNDRAANALWVWQDGVLTQSESFAQDCALGSILALPGSVQVGGEEKSYARPGINVVVLERDTGRWIHTVTWSTEHNYQVYTR